MTRRSVGFAAALIALATSCGPDVTQTEPLADRKRELLANAADLILPTYRAFSAEAAALEAAAEALAADPSEANLAAAQDAWMAAMDTWQRAEMFRLGPAGMSGTTGVVGGMNLRDQIYSFPNTNTCRIDQETLEGAYEDVDAFASELVDVRGLDELEYLLFVTSTENTCAPTNPINADGTWAALDETQLRAKRAAYAHTLAILVRRHADALTTAWEPEGGDFAGALSTAGDGSALFESVRRAINDLAGAMVFVDTLTKDMKIGEPAAIVRCSETCLDQLESRWAARGKENVLINLRTFQTLYLGAPPGTDAVGFDDLLVEIGASDAAEELTTAIADAIAAVEAIDGTLRDAVESDRDAMVAAYDAIGVAARLFKADVTTLLDIELPANFSDND